MAKRKITIEEAFEALQKSGIQVQIKNVDPVVEQPDIYAEEPQQQKPQKVGKHTVKVSLFARHTVGSSGQVYGPGICYVPATLATHLLYQDQLARQADARFLDREHKFYVIAQRSAGGHRANVGVPVTEDTFSDFTKLPSEFLHLIRS